jgi:hypothetical protein
MPPDIGNEPNDPKEQLWLTTYDAVLYPVWMEELVNAWLLRFWSRINTAGSLLVIVTSTGSAVAVWPLWGQPQYKLAWGIIAACASLSSIFLTVVNVPERVKSQGKFHSDFLRLRLSVEAFSQDIDTMELREAQMRFRELREEGHKLIASAPPDFALTRKKRETIQDELDTILRTEGYAE